MKLEDWNERERIERARPGRRERKVYPAGPEHIDAQRAAEIWTRTARKRVPLTHLDVPETPASVTLPLALVVVILLVVLFAVLGHRA